MKGLILKDFYLTLKYCRLYLLIAVFFWAVSLWGDENPFFLSYPALMFGMSPLTLMGVDERCGWARTCGFLPLSRAKIVSARYLFTLILDGATLLLSGVVLAVKMGMQGGFRPMEWAVMLSGCLLASALPGVFCLPMFYRWGVEKGRIAYLVIIGVLFALFFTLFPIFGDHALLSIGGLLARGYLFPVILAVGSAVLFALSWTLSAAIYRKKDI